MTYKSHKLLIWKIVVIKWEYEIQQPAKHNCLVHTTQRFPNRSSKQSYHDVITIREIPKIITVSFRKSLESDNNTLLLTIYQSKIKYVEILLPDFLACIIHWMIQRFISMTVLVLLVTQHSYQLNNPVVEPNCHFTWKWLLSTLSYYWNLISLTLFHL